MRGDLRKVSRRGFLKRAAATVGALGLGAAAAPAQEQKPLPKRPLPPTDLEVSVIGFGTEFLQGPEVIEYCIERGVNYIDTAANYQKGNAERQLKPILARHKDKNLIVGTKVRGERDGNFTKQDFLDEFNRCCERMGVEGVDIFFLHDRRSAKEVYYPGAYEAFQEVHAQGRARWFGMSTHLRQVECVNKAIELGWFHVLLVAYHFMSSPAETEALIKARKAGMGIMTMKAVKALSAGRDWFPRATEKQKQRLKDIEAPNLFQAAIRWNLMHDFCSCVVLCMMSYKEAEMDLPAAFGEITAAEKEALRLYAEAMHNQVCRACGACQDVCPQGLAIPTIMRYLDYFKGYGAVHRAIAAYRGLPPERTYAACLRCGACEEACPYGLPIPRRLEEAHKLMA